MKQIVVVGAGFGGLAAALALSRAPGVRSGQGFAAEITLIDRESYQLYHPNLYEIATAEEELTSLVDLKHSITLPLAEILRGRQVNFVQGTITSVISEQRQIIVDAAKIDYDFLILALGSTSNFYGIPGVEEHAIPVKSLHDALRIRDKIEFVIQAHRYDMSKPYIRVAVAGGGFAGVETAAELQKLIDFVAWKNNFPREKIETLLIEGTDRILPGLDDVVARDVTARLHDLGVRTQVSSFVVKAEPEFLEFKNGERLEYDCLIWTAGVKANPLPITSTAAASAPATDRGGRVIVDGFLRIPGQANIFVIGDNCSFMDQQGRPLPGTIPQAEHQARYVADVIAAELAGRKPRAYACRQFGYIIPVGGKWAVVKTPRIYIKGWLGYAIREFVGMRWLAGLIGWWKAFKLVYFEEKIYSKND